MVKADGSTAPQLSVVQDGTTSGLISAMTVGSSFTVDIYINNTQNVVPGINAISYGVAFNPAVLQVTASTDGDINSVPYLGVKQQNLGDLPPDNVNGFVVFGQIHSEQCKCNSMRNRQEWRRKHRHFPSDLNWLIHSYNPTQQLRYRLC